jgi:DNA-binding PucR family transcriptional regulator
LAAYSAMALASRGSREDRLRAAAEAAAPLGARVVRTRAGAIAILTPTSERQDPAPWAEDVRARIAVTLGDPTVSAGVAGPKRDAGGAHQALLQAEQALLVGRALHGEGRSVSFSQLGPYCFVLGQPTSEIREFCERVLGALDDDLIRTLEEYVRSHGSVKTVAARLFLHRNTVRQRLRRISQLTGADLDDADSRLAMQLAILGRRALEQLAS